MKKYNKGFERIRGWDRDGAIHWEDGEELDDWYRNLIMIAGITPQDLIEDTWEPHRLERFIELYEYIFAVEVTRVWGKPREKGMLF